MSVIDALGGLAGGGLLATEGLFGRRPLTILIFHRVLAHPESVPIYDLDAAAFDRMLAMLAHNFRVMALGEAVDLLQEDRLPPRALVITFDDGYADNATVALPILRAHGVKATFFVSTGALDGGCMWNDVVIHRVCTSRRERIDLSEIGLGTFSLASRDDRTRAVYEALGRVKYMSSAQRAAALDVLARATGVADQPRDLMMSSDQVRELARCGMEIGGHTVNHPILAQVDPEESMREIELGRRQLQSLVDAPVDTFAYPNGRPHEDYTPLHVEQVRRAGFRAAVTTARGNPSSGDDPFQLPRQIPWDKRPRRLAARLALSRLERGFDRVGAFN